MGIVGIKIKTHVHVEDKTKIQGHRKNSAKTDGHIRNVLYLS